jgi:hypothetical protein
MATMAAGFRTSVTATLSALAFSAMLVAVLVMLRRCRGGFGVRHLIAVGVFVALVSWPAYFAGYAPFAFWRRASLAGVFITFTLTTVAAYFLVFQGQGFLPALGSAAALTFLALCVEFGCACAGILFQEDRPRTVGHLVFFVVTCLNCIVLVLIATKFRDI